MESKAPRPLAVVTGASSGIGYNLARIAAEHGYDLVVAADTSLAAAVGDFEALGARVQAVQADLASQYGLEELLAVIGGRKIDALIANAGHGLGGAFLEQDFKDIQHVIDTNITGTIYLLHRAAKLMQAQDSGRILVTGSIAGFQPGAFQAVYNGTKAFVDSFVTALRNEMKDTGVTLTCLMPGASDDRMDPAEVAEIGFKAMLRGEADVVAGLKNKVTVAEQHRKLAEPADK